MKKATWSSVYLHVKVFLCFIMETSGNVVLMSTYIFSIMHNNYPSEHLISNIQCITARSLHFSNFSPTFHRLHRLPYVSPIPLGHRKLIAIPFPPRAEVRLLPTQYRLNWPGPLRKPWPAQLCHPSVDRQVLSSPLARYGRKLLASDTFWWNTESQWPLNSGPNYISV